MPTKKGEQWYADWIVAADICMDLPGSLQESKDEVLLRLDNLLRQQDDEFAGVHAADNKRHFTAKKRGSSKTRYKKSSSLKRSSLKQTSSKDADNPSEKLERRPSFRRKFGALLRGSAELPAAINRGLQPIRRSLSFSKDLHRSHEPSRQPYRTSSVQWYNSLSSLAEDEVDADCKRAGASEEVFDGRMAQVTRTHSLMEKHPATILRRKVNILSHPSAPPYGRHSDYYYSNIDLSSPPCEASSLPALSRVAIDADDNETKLSLREQQVKNERGNFRSSVRKLSPLGNFIKQHLRVEAPGEHVEEGPTTRKSGLIRGLVRRLSGGGGGRTGRSARSIVSCGGGGGSGGSKGGGGGGGNTSPSGGCALAAGQPSVAGADSTTVSASGTPLGGRGTPSRRSSRDLSPSKKSSSASSVTGQQDAAVAGYGGGGGAGAASSSSGSGQDWRKLVGSIRRKVRRKTAQNSSSITEAVLQDTTNRNQDDFLKAAMRIFLVVSPPMGRIQVRSRSLTQLDSLSGSMLDTGEHHLEGDPSQQQPPHLHHHQQSHQLQHHPLGIECNRIRFLAPSATPAEIANSNRRHKLSRSQVSSNEYFSVSFEVGDDAATSFDREEFLPATRGTYLVDVLSLACDRRGVDLSRVEVLDSSSTPLSLLTTDAATLGGKHLRVIVKDERLNSRTPSQRGNQNALLRKASGNYRNRSGRFFSVSTEDTNVDSEVGGVSSGRSSAGATGLKASKQRWSGFFTNTKGVKMDLLTAQLDEYNKHGVPKLANVHLQCDVTINEEALYNLESDWRDIVENSQMLSEKHTQQQTALWELAETEVAYIKTLKVVTDLFMACLCSLQASNILIEVDRLKLFSNIPDIYAANHYFWTEYLLAMVNASRSSGQPLDPGYLLQGFETFEQTFAPYTRYCAEQSKCQQYCKDRMNDNQLFTAYLVWCETQKDCNRLKLMDILVMPMQRLTRYSLLLKAVYKNTENEEQRAELIYMIKSVDDFVASVNAALRRNEEAAQLVHAASRLECYDVVETKGLDEEVEKLIRLYSNLDITTAPMPGCPKDSLRTLLREGDLKLRDAASSKMEVHVLLLTDMLLICKPTTKKMLKIIRQPYVVDRIRIHEVKEPSSLGLVYLNEYGTVSAALILSAGDPKLTKSWMESLKQAQQQYASMKVPSLGEPVMNLASVSRQPSTLGDGDFEVDEYDNTFPRTPRGSSRASHVSSLAHSHSGSMEIEGASPGSSSFLPSYNASRNVSVDTNEQPRASSSLSSEEGGESSSGHNHRSMHVRRSLMNKSPTPNTLSVQVPYSSLGQSLPNLTLATSPQTSTVSPTPPNSLLIVPQMTKSKDTLLSPGHRGISYPPPSPPRGALRRGFALPQSRNPPLIKTRHVNASLTQQPAQITMGNSDTEVIEERRRRLDPSQRVPSTSSIVEEKK